jgi:hypothetical protein
MGRPRVICAVHATDQKEQQYERPTASTFLELAPIAQIAGNANVDAVARHFFDLFIEIGRGGYSQ